MIIKINDTDVTSKVLASTFKMVKNSNNQNDLSFSLKTEDTTIQSGMEVIIYKDNGVDILFGGLIQEPTKSPSNEKSIVQKLKSDGYKQILARRTVAVDYSDTTSGAIVENTFDDNLSAASLNGEEFTKGTIDSGIEILIKKGVYSLYKLYTDLAQSSGLSWWVDSYKQFNFTSKPVYTVVTKKLSDYATDLDKFVVTNLPTYKESLATYRNKQFVVGKTQEGNDVIGVAENTAEIARMKALYGSGVYGNVVTNKDIQYQIDADEAAKAILDAYADQPSYISFKTREEVDINEQITVNLLMYNIDNVDFVVEKVITRFNKTGSYIEREVFLKEYIDTAKSSDSWTDGWNGAFENNKNESFASDGGEVNVYGGYNEEAIPSAQVILIPVAFIKYSSDTKVALNTTLEMVTTASDIVRITITVGGVAKKTTEKFFTANVRNQINLNCLLDDFDDEEIELYVSIFSGEVSIEVNKFNYNLVVQYGIKYIPVNPTWDIYVQGSYYVSLSNATDAEITIDGVTTPGGYKAGDTGGEIKKLSMSCIPENRFVISTSGSDSIIANLNYLPDEFKAKLESITLTGNSRVSGNISNLYNVNSQLFLGGCSGVKGDVSSLNTITSVLDLSDCNDVTGELSKFKDVRSDVLVKNTKITGDISDLTQLALSALDISNCDIVGDLSSRQVERKIIATNCLGIYGVFSPSSFLINAVYLSGTGISVADLDTTIINVAYTTGQVGTMVLTGLNRTAASTVGIDRLINDENWTVFDANIV